MLNELEWDALCEEIRVLVLAGDITQEDMEQHVRELDLAASLGPRSHVKGVSQVGKLALLREVCHRLGSRLIDHAMVTAYLAIMQDAYGLFLCGGKKPVPPAACAPRALTPPTPYVPPLVDPDEEKQYRDWAVS